MLNIYREILPDSYLLILTGSGNPEGAGSLRQALSRAGASGKRSIWIDCGSLVAFSAATLQVLSEYYLGFQRKRLTLVLCHLTGPAAETLQLLPWAQRPPVVETLLEAAGYCRSQQPMRRPPAATAPPPAR
jgi:anti-anti-sigma regulatory factor